MAIGTTADFNLKRNQIIDSALRKIRAVQSGNEPTLAQIDEAVRALNSIVREEDLHGTGLQTNLWAADTGYLILTAYEHIYTTSTSDGLASNILELHSANYRDATGDDVPLGIITKQQYDELIDKDDTGDPEKVYFQASRLLADQSLFLDFAPSSVTTTSEVLGSDNKNYKCIMLHTSSSLNKPITGSDWKLYWTQAGTAGATWVTATAYTNGELIFYSYKRPLYDFDKATDNPDMPSGWGRYLTLRLAHDLSPEYGLALDERLWLKGQYREAREEIFPSTKPVVTEKYNKALYF